MSEDYFSKLSQEILLKIFQYLSSNDLLICSQVCSQWYYTASDNLMWYRRCVSTGITHGLTFNKEHNFWRKNFIDHLRHCQRWRGFPPVAPAIVSMHNCAVITDLVVHNGWVACCLENGTVVVVDINTQLKKHTFRLNDRGAVWCLIGFTIKGEDFLGSGGNDGIVRVWSITTGISYAELDNIDIKAIQDNRSRVVRCLAVTESFCQDDSLLLVSGGRNFVLMVWHVGTKKCVYELEGHNNSIRAVEANKEIIVSASYDGLIIMWSVATGDVVHFMSGHTDRVYNLHLSRDMIVSSSLDQTMKVWDSRTGRCIHTLQGHSSLTKDMAMDKEQRRLVSGNADQLIKVWCPHSGQCLLTLPGHGSALTSVQLVRNAFIVSSGADGMVKLWSLSDGSLVRDILTAGNYGGANVSVWKIVATDSHLICATGSTVNTVPSKLYLYNFSIPPS